MKKIFVRLTLAVTALGSVLTSCKKADEVAPNVNKPNVTVEFESANYGVQKDFGISTTVSTTGDTAFINIAVNGTQDMNRIYMTYQKDNDKEEKFTTFPDGTPIPSAGYSGTDYTGGNSEKFNYNNVTNTGTFNIPSSKSKAFKLTIPILLRNSADAKSDVFKVWIVKGGKSGDHKNPAKNIAYGVAVIKLNYTNEALISNYETVLGNSADTTGSLFATSTGSNFKRSDANNTNIGTKIDFLYNTTGNPLTLNLKYIFGSAYKAANTVDNSVCSGFDIDGPDNVAGNSDDGFYYITNVTKMVETSANFDNIVGESSLVAAVDAVISSSTTSTNVQFTSDPAGKVIAFVTAAGKKGLIKIVDASGTNTKEGQTTIQVKVQR